MAASAQHAFDLLNQPAPAELPWVIALVGDDRFLKRHVLTHLLGDANRADYDTYSGIEATWSDIADDLATVSLFGTGSRHVLVNDADGLVSRYRHELEAFAARETAGKLILDLQSLPSNTKLYRAIADRGCLVECRQPLRSGKSKQLDVKRMQEWLIDWGRERHHVKLTREAAEQLADLIGWEFGILDQELAKLALFVKPQGQVSPDLVQQVVGGWKTQTTWEMMDAVADGDAASALRQLEQLLQSGESPQALFGAMAWSLRRFAAATRIVEQQERRGVRVNLLQVVEQAGFRRWPADALPQAKLQLQQISRRRGDQLYRWLLETDLALKGSHSTPHRARWALEHLILRLARQARPAR